MEAAHIGAGTTLRRTERGDHGERPEEMVLLDVDGGTTVRFNATGAWLWDQLTQPRRVTELASGLAEHFAIDDKRALGDVVAFAREMARRDLLAPS